MFANSVEADVRQLASVDVATCDGAGLAALVTVSGRVRSWLDAVDVAIALRAGELAASGVAPCPSDVVADGGRRTARDAGAVARRAGACDLLPDVHAALAAGDLSAGHVDAIARTASALDAGGRSELAALQATLIANAATSSVEAFSRDMGRLERILSGDDGLSNRPATVGTARCAAGSTAPPGCATPISNSTPRPTPEWPPPSTPPSPHPKPTDRTRT